jgi:NADH:ubiquinone oxidoreductase subunit E
VYLTVDRERQQQQREERAARRPESQEVAAASSRRIEFPAGYDMVLVLEVLIQIIKTPQANVATLARAVRARGLKINAAQVQRVIDFYAIKKKRPTVRRGTGPGSDSSTDR